MSTLAGSLMEWWSRSYLMGYLVHGLVHIWSIFPALLRMAHEGEADTEKGREALWYLRMAGRAGIVFSAFGMAVLWPQAAFSHLKIGAVAFVYFASVVYSKLGLLMPWKAILVQALAFLAFVALNAYGRARYLRNRRQEP